MAGISIILGGDLGPLLEAFARLRAMVRRLAQQISLALRPVRIVFDTVFQGARIAAQTAFRAITGTARAAANTIRGAFSGLGNLIPGGGMVAGLLGLAGTAGAIAAAVSQFKVGSDIAAHFERTRISLVALTGTVSEAESVLAEMRRMWQLTGMTVEDQAATIQKFIALGFSSDDALKLQRNILDIAGAVGMTAANAELLGSALAQVKAKGVVSMEELRQQIAEKGIPVFEELAAKMGVTQSALIAMVEKGQVPAQELLDVFMNMQGTFANFRGGAAKMSGTFSGMVGSLRAAWQLLLADFAAPINMALKPLLQQATDAVNGLRARAVAMGRAIANALLAAFALIKSGKIEDLLAVGMGLAMAGATEILSRGFRSAVAFLATALPPIFESAVATFKDPTFWAGVGNLLRGIGMQMAAEIQNILPGNRNKEAAGLLRSSSDLAMDIGRNQVIGSGGGADFAKLISSALVQGGKAAKAAAGGPVGREMREAVREYKKLRDTVGREMEVLWQESAVPLQDRAPVPAAAGIVSSLAAAAGQILTIASSTARIGGGGFGMTLMTPMVSEQKKSNTLLAKLVEQGSSARVATFA